MCVLTVTEFWCHLYRHNLGLKVFIYIMTVYEFRIPGEWN